MSRIVRGPSADIIALRAIVDHSSEAKSHVGSVFKTAVSSSYLTEDELAQKLQDAKIEGFKEAERRAMGQVSAALQNIETIMDVLGHFRRELFKESETDVLNLVCAVAKRIITKEVSLNPELLKSIVEKALLILEKEKRIVLLVNPLDLEMFEKAKPGFLEKYKALEDLSIQSDSRIEAGHVLARTQRIELDLKTDTMTDQLLSQIKASKTSVNATNDDGDVV